MTKRWLSTTEAGTYLGYSTQTITRLCRTGSLRHRRIGSRNQYRFLQPWLDELLDCQTGPVLPDPVLYCQSVAVSPEGLEGDPDEFTAMIAAARRRTG